MSVLIKGIGMPETCDDCQFHRYHSHGEYVCVATPMFYSMNLANSKGIRKDWCPLVELSEHHGRLFDQDDVKAVLYDMPDTKDKWDAIALLEWAIDKRWCIEAEGAD